MSSKRFMIIAGEASGDMHGARLVRAIRKRSPDAFVFGVGANAMQGEGTRIIVDSRELSVVGLTEVISKLPTIYRAMGLVKKSLHRLRPDLLILIDFPDFNFRVAAVAKKLKIPVLYYISPQIWAWRQNRVKKIKRLVDHMAVILPFEASFYRKHGVPVTFVGHPLLDRIPPAIGHDSNRYNSEKPVIGLLPGSREKEVTTLLPVILQAAQRIDNGLPAVKFLVSCSTSIKEDLLEDIFRQYAGSLDVSIVKGPVEPIFKESCVLVGASGTVTLEAALHGTPTVIVYKVSPLSYWLGKRLIKVDFIGLVNLIAKKPLMPELIQEDASPQTIAETVIRMVSEPEKLRQLEKELLGVRELLGGAGASDRVAKIAFDLIHRSERN
ncbi:lipid-A-disaccharide synthase [Desulfosarcina widdelii]|uniref:Lipid-A-disaccharide synthase n=1 Tax=Desulfosarcina widdelii TaxID=947919 RepID=A0A5K7YVY8_9BACT|nr:lipid-A-disaccharide synthase [Desulfosarcina widdelii]BBO73912.1 lipid-A-disaccharide synthase [Desulfosarcina widdelii]